MKVTPGKRKGLKAVSDSRGVIAAAAMDQRGSLKNAIAKEKGVDKKEVTAKMLEEFKTAVTSVLTPYASAILLDPEYGLPASMARAKNAGLLLAYENSGYDNTQARSPARPARYLVGPPPRGRRRRLHQDPALLHAVRRARGQRDQARLGRAHRRGMRGRGHSVFPGVGRLRGRRRRKEHRLRAQKARHRHAKHGGVFQAAVRTWTC